MMGNLTPVIVYLISTSLCFMRGDAVLYFPLHRLLFFTLNYAKNKY